MLPNINSWRKKVLVVGLILALFGCDDTTKQSDEQNTTSMQSVEVNDTEQQGVLSDESSQISDTQQENTAQEQVTSVASPQTSPLTTAELREKYRNKSLTILDTSELILDGASTLVVTFSIPLDTAQNVSNVVRLIDKEKGSVDGAWELSDNGLELRHRYLEPNRKLILNIDKQIKAVNGNSLADSYQVELKTRERLPMVGFASKGALLPSQSATGLPVMTLNVDRIDVNFFKVKQDKLYSFLQNYGSITSLSTWQSNYALTYTDLIYTGRFDLKTKKDVQENVLLDLSNIEALKQDGIYLAVMSQAGTYNYSNPVMVFTVSNIGLSVHRYNNGNMSIFTQALDTGKPLSDINIALVYKSDDEKYDYMSNIGATNENGFLEESCDSCNPKLVLATDGKQASVIELGRNALDLTEFNITGSKFFDKQLFTFGPRDLYRPGETVYMNALLRDADGKPVTKQPIKVELIKPDGQSASEYIWQSEDNQVGFYQTQYRIPADAPTGKWSFKFNLGDDNYRYSYFSVEEFLPERMAMELLVPSEKPLLNNQNIKFDIKGWYLYGAPASGNELQGQIYLNMQRQVAQLPGFQIGSITNTITARQITEVDQYLDNSGLTTIEVNNQHWRNIKAPVEIRLQASLLDAGGRPVTRQVKQTIWPAQKMPAIRPLFNNNEYYDWRTGRYVTRPTVDQGSLAEFEIAYVNTNGEKTASDSLTARIIKERRDYYWTWSDSEGWQFKYDQKEFTVAEEKLAVAANNVAKFSYITDDWGSYRIEVTDAQTKLVSSMRFWSGYDWGDNTDGTGSVRPDQVKLSIDKLTYDVGDTAIIHVEAPTAGSGYIAVESNSGTLWFKDISVPEGGVDVEIPIGDWQRHDVYVSAVVVRASDNIEVQTIKRAVGLLYLPLATESRNLNLQIDAPKQTLPDQSVTIKIKADHAVGQKVTVLLSAVDSGVLNITNFVTPDPYTELLGRKRYDVDQYDVYGKLIEGKGRLVSTSFGGDSDESNELSRGGKKPLSLVTIVAQQLKTIELDENGEGTFELALPDFNGELRLMAQAWSDDRFGKAEQKMTIAAPMIVELATPRFLSGGDRSLTALDLRNLTDTEQTIKITINTEGLVSLENSEPIEVTLAAKERQILQIPVIADYGYGQGVVSVNVDGLDMPGAENTQMTRAWTLGVRPAYAADLRSYSFVLKAGEEWNLSQAALVDLIPNTVESKLVISNQPPINIAEYIKQLFAYPYGCLEQTISGLYPSLYANQEQLAQLGIKTESDEERRQKITIGIERILGMQRNNGSFGLWSKESSESYWLTAYATDFLLRARERGYSVNEKALNKAMNRLGEYLYDTSAFHNSGDYYSYGESQEYSQFAVKSYAALILARQNKLTPGIRNALNRLYLTVKNGDQKVLRSPLPIAQLAIASELAGYNKAADKLMTIAFNTKRSNHYYWYGDYGSVIRDNALILSLLMESKRYQNEQMDYLLNLSKDLNEKRYLSTQELNAVFIAGWSLLQNNAGDQWSIDINGNSLTADKPRTFGYSMDTLAKGLSLKNTLIDSPLYVRLDISGYNETAPEPTSVKDTLTIRRDYYDMQGNLTSIDNMNVGDLVLVMLEVGSKTTISDALVVDLLPAGLEIENQNLANSSVNIDSIPGISELLKGENAYDVKYQEYRDDRYVTAVSIYNYYSRDNYRKRAIYLARAVTPGTYVVPAPYVESMYHPEWFAIGKTVDLMTVSEKDQSK